MEQNSQELDAHVYRQMNFDKCQTDFDNSNSVKKASSSHQTVMGQLNSRMQK